MFHGQECKIQPKNHFVAKKILLWHWRCLSQGIVTHQIQIFVVSGKSFEMGAGTGKAQFGFDHGHKILIEVGVRVNHKFHQIFYYDQTDSLQ